MRRIVAVACAMVALSLMLVAQSSSAAVSDPGTLRVTVVDEAGQPVPGVNVVFGLSNGRTYRTNAEGVATTGPGWSDLLQACWYADDGSIAFQCWDQQPGNSGLAKEIDISNGKDVELSVVALPAAHIFGQLNDYVTGKGVDAAARVVAEIYANGRWNQVGNAVTPDITGFPNSNYSVGGLPPGMYRVSYAKYDSPWIAQWSGGADTADEADTFILGLGESKRADAVLMPSGHLSGRVNTPDNRSAVDVGIYIFHQVAGSWEVRGLDGAWDRNTFEEGRIPPGRYLIKFASSSYTTKWWDGASTMASATEIVVGPGERIENLDVTLQYGTPDRLVNLTPPTLLGDPVVGAVLSYDPGTWSPTPAGYSPRWFIDGCYAGNLNTFEVSSRMAGHAVSLVVNAFSSSGDGSLAAPPIPPLGGYQDRCFPMDQAPPTTVYIPGVAPPLLYTYPAQPQSTSSTPAPERPKLTGRPVVGKRLKITGVGPIPPEASVTYGWFSNSKRVRGADGPSIRIRDGHRGTRIRARITISAPGYAPITFTTARSRVIK